MALDPTMATYLCRVGEGDGSGIFHRYVPSRIGPHFLLGPADEPRFMSLL
jgi:hypothetical protein